MMNAIAEIQPRSVLVDMSGRFGMEPAAFESTVRATCSPKGRNAQPLSREEFAAFLLVAKEYDLNPLTKEIYAFPAKGGGIVPVVSVDGWINLINSKTQCDGFEFEMDHDEKENLISCTCRIYRKDRKHPTTVTEYLSECIRDTEPWRMKHRMLRHKSLIQAARYAFGFAGIYDEDEGERIAGMRDVTPSAPPVPPPAPVLVTSPPPVPQTGPIEEPDMPEFLDRNKPDVSKFETILDDFERQVAGQTKEGISELCSEYAPLLEGATKADWDRYNAISGGN